MKIIDAEKLVTEFESLLAGSVLSNESKLLGVLFLGAIKASIDHIHEWSNDLKCTKCGESFDGDDNDVVNNDEPKTCCGQIPELVGTLGRCFYRCPKCHLQTFSVSNNREAIELWNKNATMRSYVNTNNDIVDKVLAAKDAEPVEVPKDKEGYFDYLKDGWIPFNGNYCPVHPETIIKAIYADNTSCGMEQEADQFWWGEDEEGRINIKAYKIIKEYKEPESDDKLKFYNTQEAIDEINNAISNSAKAPLNSPGDIAPEAKFEIKDSGTLHPGKFTGSVYRKRDGNFVHVSPEGILTNSDWVFPNIYKEKQAAETKAEGEKKEKRYYVRCWDAGWEVVRRETGESIDPRNGDANLICDALNFWEENHK